MQPTKTLSRRHFLKYLGTSAATLAAAYSGLTPLTTKAQAASENTYDELPDLFNPTQHSATNADKLLLAGGFAYSVLAAYGDRINALGDLFGVNSNYTALYPIPEATDEAMLWVNHESIVYTWMLDRSKAITWEQQKQMLSEQGASILHLKKDELGSWKLAADSKRARRISGLTPMSLTGPVSGEKAVNGASLVQGTLANRSGSQTLWNTQLTCENHIEATVRDVGLDPSHYGWIVEVNPFDVQATPVKHTALGRFHHGSAAMTLSADQRVIVYMGEDSPEGYIYKFVSNGSYSTDSAQDNSKLLHDGTLYAADLIHNRWIELSLANVRAQLNKLSYQVPDAMYKSKETLLAQFASQSDVLASAKEAAWIIGATPCDRPAEVTIHPTSKALFVACTQNESRGNLHGHILQLQESIGLSFTSHIFISGGHQSGFSCPGSMSFDKNNNLWVASDIPTARLNTASWADFKNNGLYLIHPSGSAQRTKQIASAPNEAALSGLSFTNKEDALFLAVNHPGASGAGTNKPTSQWQCQPSSNQPRSAVVMITRTIL